MNKNTIQFIAKQAEVSTATISRVLNNSGPVKEETRQRVLGVVKKYNYTPSALAQGLSKQTSSTIGIIVPEISNPFFGSIIRGATKVADRNNLSVICFDSGETVGKDLRAIEMFKRQRVRGLLYTPATSYSDDQDKERLLDALSGFDGQVVLVDRKLDFLSCGGVYFNDFDSVYRATSILLESGHRRIATINAYRQKILADNRQNAYEKALRDHGVVLDPALELFGDYTLESGYEMTLKLLEMKERPSAVITFNNSLSKGFAKAITEKHIRIPEDIVCFGLDRVEEMEFVGIHFNCIERNSYKMGVAAMEKIVGLRAADDETIIQANILTTGV